MILDHWHPVLKASALGAKPVAVRLAGEAIAVFRTRDGAVGAIEDRCVHRRMKLSEGWVDGAKLVCPYHGWSYSCSGEATSPGTPKLCVQARTYDAAIWNGAIWIRSKGANSDFPRMETDGYRFSAYHAIDVAAPLALVLDNFIEVEHTPTTHALFGYDARFLADVEVKLELTPDAVRVINFGRQKPLPLGIRLAFGIGRHDGLVDDWTTRFSPVHTVYEQYWTKPGGREARGDKLRIFVFFNPIDDETTQLVVFTWAHLASWRGPVFPLLKRLLGRLVFNEIKLDKTMVEKIADKSPSLDGMKLSRFDKPLAEARRRIESIYRGRPALSVVAD